MGCNGESSTSKQTSIPQPSICQSDRIPTAKIQTYRDAFERIFQETGEKTNEMMMNILDEVMWWRENGRNGFCPVVRVMTKEQADQVKQADQVEQITTLEQYVQLESSTQSSYIDLIASSCKT